MTKTRYHFGTLTAMLLLAALGATALVLVVVASAGARSAQAQDTTTADTAGTTITTDTASGTTIKVNTKADQETDQETSDNKCSLREAIKAANTNLAVDRCPAGSATGEDSIRFDLGSSATITLDQTLGDLGVSDATGLVVNGKAKGADVTVSGNDAVRVFFVDEGAKLALRNLTVAHGNANKGSGFYPYGGGLRNLGTAEVRNSTFSDNSANLKHGGGIDNQGTLTVSDSTFSNNSAAIRGGGINNFDSEYGEVSSKGILKVSDTTFSENSAGSYGGGIYNEWGTLEVSGTTFSKNHASVTGGGIYSYRNTGTLNTVTLTNATFSENSARNGAGIENSAGTLEVSYSTFSKNSASESGGAGFQDHDGTGTLRSTIIADSTSSDDENVNCFSYGKPINDGGYNISSDASCNLTDQTSKNDTDPLLSSRGLRNNGGPTKTIGLLSSSPARNAIPKATNGCGTEVKRDQRGVKRPQGKSCDIGAFEKKKKR